MSTPLIRGGERLLDDAVLLTDEAALPDEGRFILSLERWRRERATLPVARVGVLIPNSEDVLTLWPELQGLSLIALQFPKSGDGRAFSQARLLRQRCGYSGELRAVGDVLRDQLQFMQRCGFDAYLLREDQDAAACLQAFADFDTAYQQAVDALPNVWALRRAGG